MTSRLLLILSGVSMIGGMTAAMGNSVAPGRIAPARDGDIAIVEELCAARKAGTAAAFDLFIARHPKHPLAEQARRERAKLAP